MDSAELRDAISWLFVPASRPDRFARAAASGADVVVIDLEDAVAADGKDEARANLVRDWPAGADVPVVVRVNGLGTDECADDLAACRALRPAAVMLPKAERGDDVRAVADAAAVPVVPIVESARGLVSLGDLVTAELVRLAFGSIDLALDLGVSDDAALDSARADVVRWSAASGLPRPLDGVSTAIRDADVVTRETARAKAWGFGGKLCIHPSQLPLVHAAFAPDEEELAWARRVLDAANGATGAASVDGAMIDRPVVERARRIVRAAEAGGQ